jgi:ABC-type phosphate transport system ATPase subunit
VFSPFEDVAAGERHVGVDPVASAEELVAAASALHIGEEAVMAVREPSGDNTRESSGELSCGQCQRITAARGFTARRCRAADQARVVRCTA